MAEEDGGLVEMPEEIGPQITQTSLPLRGTSGQVDADLRAKRDNPRISQNKIKEEDENDLYRGHYMEPDRIFSDEANMIYKVIYCAACKVMVAQ